MTKACFSIQRYSLDAKLSRQVEEQAKGRTGGSLLHVKL